MHTLRNKPVTINHKDNIGDDDKVGEVLNVWYNPEDGWYWCDGIITDETAINLINDKNWSVSCSYDFTKYDDEGGTENNIPYDIEFLDGEFNHLAIVDNPRYEGANIVFNSKGVNTQSFKEQFAEAFYEALAEVIVENCVNNDKWITIHPNGKDEKGRPLKLEDGESPKEAIKRTYGVDLDKTKEDKYEQDITKLMTKREDLVKEFKSSDYFRQKEIVKENQNIIQQIWSLRGKQTADKRQKLLKNAGNYQNKLLEIVNKNENVINSIVSVEDNLQEETQKWIEIGKQREKLRNEYTELRSQFNKDNYLVLLKEEELHKNFVEYQKQANIVNTARQEKYKSINRLLQISNGADIEFKTSTKSQKVKENLDKGKELLNGIISKDIMPKEPVKAMAIKGGKGRCHYSHNNDRLEMANEANAPDVAHELMHWLEKKNPKVLDNSLTFLEYRTQGEEAQQLKVLTGIKKYDTDEVAKPDNFFSPYCGKIYNHQATEIMSMGIERIFENPKEFAETDREYMSFVISNLRGEI